MRLRLPESFRPKDASHDDKGEFRGQQRSNDTHRSTRDPEAKLYRKSSGQEAKLSYQGDVLIDNRRGLAVEATLTEANGRAEREAALEMTRRSPLFSRVLGNRMLVPHAAGWLPGPRFVALRRRDRPPDLRARNPLQSERKCGHQTRVQPNDRMRL